MATTCHCRKSTSSGTTLVSSTRRSRRETITLTLFHHALRCRVRATTKATRPSISGVDYHLYIAELPGESAKFC